MYKFTITDEQLDSYVAETGLTGDDIKHEILTNLDIVDPNNEQVLNSITQDDVVLYVLYDKMLSDIVSRNVNKTG